MVVLAYFLHCGCLSIRTSPSREVLDRVLVVGDGLRCAMHTGYTAVGCIDVNEPLWSPETAAKTNSIFGVQQYTSGVSAEQYCYYYQAR